MMDEPEKVLDRVDHIALEVKDIDATVRWYKERFNCSVSYQDDTWAMLEFGNINIAFVIAREHPPHVGIEREDASSFGKLKKHRDGSESCYLADPGGNTLEVLKPYVISSSSSPKATSK